MKEIKLQNSELKAIVDNEDYLYLSKRKWGLSKKGYAWGGKAYYDNNNKRKTKTELIHRLVMKVKKGQIIDHINRDRLDNRKCNLRICSRFENQCNRPAPKHNTSGYKGVSFNKRDKLWHSRIKFKNKPYYLGAYKTPILAAIEYNKKAEKLHGEFALLNVIQS